MCVLRLTTVSLMTLFVAGCGGSGGATDSGTRVLDTPTPPNPTPGLTETNAATLASFVAARGPEMPRFDREMLTTPGSATYTGFVAISRDFEATRIAANAGSDVELNTAYQNGPIGALEVDITFGATPTLEGKAGNFVAVADADILIPDGERAFADNFVFDPNSFIVDPDLPLINIPGELTLTGLGIATTRDVVDGVLDDSTARFGISVDVTGTLEVPAGVGGLDEAADFVVDEGLSLAVASNAVSGSAVVEVENGNAQTTLQILAIK